MATQTVSAGTLTGAGALSGILDISGIAGDVTLSVTCSSLLSASGVPSAVVVVEDSIDAFAEVQEVVSVNFTGPISPVSPVTVSFRRYAMVTLRNGIGGAVLRGRVAALGGTTPTITASVELHS